MLFRLIFQRCGGFTEAMRIASLAWDRGLPVANHGFTTYINVRCAALVECCAECSDL